MTTIDDLEAQLRDGLDRAVDPDIVVVYADQLQALGDPRGELIVVDLEIEQSGGSPALTKRRAELIEQWLGSQRPHGRIRYGFVDLDATSADPIEQVRTALGSKAARFIRSVTAVGPPKSLGETIAAITEEPRPFLSRLTLRQWNDGAQPVIESSTALAPLTNLQRLEVDARTLFDRLEHPALRSLRISGCDAFASADLPSLTELDLAIQCHLATGRAAPDERFFQDLGAGMPKLTSLDLSRNEPGYLDPHTLGGDTQIFLTLGKLGCRGRLEKLVLPPPDQAGIASIKAALRTMPALRELTFRRATDRSMLKQLERADLAIRFD